MRIHEVMSTGVVAGRTTDTVRDVVVKMLSRHQHNIALFMFSRNPGHGRNRSVNVSRLTAAVP